MRKLDRSIAAWTLLAAVLFLAIAGEIALAFGMHSRTREDLRGAEKNRQTLCALGPAAARREALLNCAREFEASLPQIADKVADDPLARAALAMELSAKLREDGMSAADADAAARIAAPSDELAGLVHSIGSRGGVTLEDLRTEGEGALVHLRLGSRIEILPDVLTTLAGLHQGGRIVSLSLRPGVAGVAEVGLLYGEGSGQ